MFEFPESSELNVLEFQKQLEAYESLAFKFKSEEFRNSFLKDLQVFDSEEFQKQLVEMENFKFDKDAFNAELFKKAQELNFLVSSEDFEGLDGKWNVEILENLNHIQIDVDEHERLRTLIENELIKDGLISSREKYSIDLSGKRMKINGKKQPDVVWKKYKALYKEVYKCSIGEKSKFAYSKNRGNERSSHRGNY